MMEGALTDPGEPSHIDEVGQVDDWGGPYALAAFLCEQTLTDQDGLISAIRIMDRIQVSRGAEQANESGVLQLPIQGLIVLRGSPDSGPKSIRLSTKSPSGEIARSRTYDIEFAGPHMAVNLRLEVLLTIGLNESGLYWTSVECDGRLLSKFSVLVEFTEDQNAQEIPSTEK